MDHEKPRGEATFDPALGLFHRGAHDLFIPSGGADRSGWQGLLPVLDERSLVLDLGAHIGWFVQWVLKHSRARRFLCVEPDPSNLVVLRQNLGAFGLTPGEVSLEAAAVTMYDAEGVPFYLGDHPASHTVIPIKGRRSITIRTVAFASLLARSPTVIKCDIEGGEFLLDWSKLPPSVRGVSFDFHPVATILESQMHRIEQQLLSQGFAAAHPLQQDPLEKVFYGVYTR